MLPWNLYEKRADELGRGPMQRAAAQELCDLDDAQQRQVFTKPTRNKLERLLRDKRSMAAILPARKPPLCGLLNSSAGSSNASRCSSPNRLRPILPLRLIAPVPAASLPLPVPGCASAGLMHAWDQAGGDVDGLLLRAADDEDLGDVLAAFVDAGLAAGAPLPLLQLRLHADDGSTVQVDWRPDLDDAALLRSALLFCRGTRAHPCNARRADDARLLRCRRNRCCPAA